MRQIGPYSVVRVLYSGPRIEVLLARRRGPGRFTRPVAIKRLRREAEGDDDAVRSLLDEAHLQGLVTHPGVVGVHELLALGGAYNIVMDWVDGMDLGHMQARCQERGGAVPLQHALYIAREVARALEATHSAREESGSPAYIVHRDVTPRNILVGWDGTVHLTDFGVAQAARRLTETRVMSVKGTPGYLSPEQASLADVDGRSDLFSLGVCLFQMVTGRLPFAGDSVEALIHAARDASFRPLQPELAHLPEGFAELLRGFLARLPRQRFADGRNASIALSRYLHHLAPDYTGEDLPGFLAAIFPETGAASEPSVDTDVYRRPA